jgi:hypothetical protein
MSYVNTCTRSRQRPITIFLFARRNGQFWDLSATQNCPSNIRLIGMGGPTIRFSSTSGAICFAENTLVENVTFYSSAGVPGNAWYVSTTVSNQDNIRFVNCDFLYDSTASSTSAAFVAFQSGSSEDSWTNCNFEDLNTGGIPLLRMNCSNSRVVDCYFYGVVNRPLDIISAAQSASITGCQFYLQTSAVDAAIYVNYIGVSITGCTFMCGSSVVPSIAWIEQLGTGWHLTVSGCTFHGSASAQGVAVHLYGTSYLYAPTFTGNTVKDMYIEQNAPGATITGNTIVYTNTTTIHACIDVYASCVISGNSLDRGSRAYPCIAAAGANADEVMVSGNRCDNTSGQPSIRGAVGGDNWSVQANMVDVATASSGGAGWVINNEKVI